MRIGFKITIFIIAIVAVSLVEFGVLLKKGKQSVFHGLDKQNGFNRIVVPDLEDLAQQKKKEGTIAPTSIIIANETNQVDQSKQLGSSTKLNAYERSLLEKAVLRERFLEQLKHQQQKKYEDEGSDTKYLVLFPVFSGLGNNMAVLAETILISFMTNRRFYLYKWKSFSEYFDLPFDNYMLPDNSISENEDAMFIRKKCDIPPDDILNSTKKFVVLRVTCKMVDYLCFSDRYHDFLNKNGFIINPQLNSKPDIRKTMMEFLYNHVIMVKPDIRESIEKVKADLKWDQFYIIGMQIRTGKLGGDDAPDFFLQRDDIEIFLIHAKAQTEKALNKTTKPIKWYVATDNRMVRRKIRNQFPNYYIDHSCLLTHSNADLGRVKRSVGLLCTLIDSYLLSAVDEAIITAKSTFGILSVNRSPKMKRIQVMYGDYKKYLNEKKGNMKKP